jgi:endonuclease/exonuclease/phosphatase (EEP) superfamily protein YafD
MNDGGTTAPGWAHRHPGRFLVALVGAGAFVALIGTVLGFFGRWHWFLDLFAHFRGQYFAALAAAGLLLAWARHPRAAAAMLTGSALNGLVLAPLFLPPPPVSSAAADDPPLRLVAYNVLYGNHRQAPTLEWLRTAGADIVFLCEVTPDWSAALRSLKDVYPHQHHHPQAGPFGCALLSRHPWTHLEEKQFGPFEAPSLAVRLPWQGREILVLGMHPTPPNGRLGSSFRNSALAEAADFLAAHPVRTQVLAGDLNATPWSRPLRALLARTGLEDSARGHGWQPTWNVRSPLFQIPIDHVLVSPDLRVPARVIGPDLGSDHRAVTVELRAAAAQ